jgi:hypothetical protein
MCRPRDKITDDAPELRVALIREDAGNQSALQIGIDGRVPAGR